MTIYQAKADEEAKKRLESTALALGCAMARTYIHSDAGVKQWAAKSVELARALLKELDEAAK